jgi:hypothetical protein
LSKKSFKWLDSNCSIFAPICYRDPSSVDEIVTQLSQYHGSPETSDLEMRSVESFVDSPTDQNQVPSILGSTEDDRKVEEDNDPSKCSVCKEAAGKHSYYGNYMLLLKNKLILFH